MDDDFVGYSKEFDLGDVLSVTTGTLLSSRGLDGVCDLLSFMTGKDPLPPHLMIGVAFECRKHIAQIYAQLPEVAPMYFQLFPDSKQLEQAHRRWVDARKVDYGDTLLISPLSPEIRKCF